jgi:predicted nucleic acid-binding protein
MQILIDTSIIIDFLRQKNKKSTQLYKLVANDNQLAISILTHTELYSGKSVWSSKKAAEELDKILVGIKVLPITPQISTMAGEIKVKNSIDLIDAVIASTGVIEKLPLLTLNKRHFQKIKKLKLI